MQWSEVRLRNREWLLKWEPMRIPGTPDPATDREAFAVRCSARERERQLGAGYGFGIFVDGKFAGEINLNSVHRGPFQNAYIGYWIDEAHAGHGLHARGVVRRVAVRASRSSASTACRSRSSRATRASRRVVEKLDIREEGTALRYLEINGVWEDHVRYAMTVEEWEKRRDELTRRVDVGGAQLFDEIFGLQRGETLAEPRLVCVDHTCGASSRLTASSCESIVAIVGERLLHLDHELARRHRQRVRRSSCAVSASASSSTHS